MRLISPMLATLGEPPEEMDGGWAAEMKYDGFRLLAGVGGGAHPVLWTRNLNVVTSSYPEVTEALTEAFGGHGRIVFDGEIVALTQGRPSFARLQKRANTLRPTTALRRQVPVTYVPFDVLRLDGDGLMVPRTSIAAPPSPTSATSSRAPAFPSKSHHTGKASRVRSCSKRFAVQVWKVLC